MPEKREKNKIRYRKISVKIHADAKFRQLSPPWPSAQSLFIHLITHPDMILPGVLPKGKSAIAEELGWPMNGLREIFSKALPEGLPKGLQEALPKAFRKGYWEGVCDGFEEACSEVIEKGLIIVDWSERLIWIPNAIKHNNPESPNVITGWKQWWEEGVPECELKAVIYRGLEDYVATLSEGFQSAFYGAIKPFGKPFGKASPKTSLNPEPEPEPEYNRKTKPKGLAKKDKSPSRNQQSKAALESFAITDEIRQWCLEKGLPFPDDELEGFKDHHLSAENWKRYRDWKLTFRNWMRNKKKPVSKNIQPPNQVKINYVGVIE